jgi:hypothetical protein
MLEICRCRFGDEKKYISFRSSSIYDFHKRDTSPMRPTDEARQRTDGLSGEAKATPCRHGQLGREAGGEVGISEMIAGAADSGQRGISHRQSCDGLSVSWTKMRRPRLYALLLLVVLRKARELKFGNIKIWKCWSSNVTYA